MPRTVSSRAAEPLLAGLGFQPGEMAVELARFRRAARWLVAWERQRRAQGITVDQVEIRGEITLAGPAGDFVLHGRADRFDRHPDGRVDVIDYKTGSSASPKEVAAGFDPQLPLTAAMVACEGGFPGLGTAPVAGLYYLSLPGNAAGGEARRVDGGRQPEAGELAARAIEDLEGWIARFDDETTPYESQTRAKYTNDYGDFDHLARRGEWASAPGGTEGDS